MTKITAYAALASPADADVIPGVDVSDTSMAASGTTKALALSVLKTYVKAGPAFAQGQPANPAGTTSATLVMMGVGTTCKITPGSGGKVQVMITGEISESAGAVTTTWGPRFGTGTAPANAAAVTGTRWGTAADYTTQTAAGIKIPFAFVDLLTLTPATAYWFDIALGSNGAATATVTNLSFVAEEIT
jgi:hypothetical protein